jgi:hypothetical protein
VAFTPNGSAAFRESNEEEFRKLWNKVHQNLLTDEFYEKLFAGRPLLLASYPYDLDQLQTWDRKSPLKLSLAGNELLCATVL